MRATVDFHATNAIFKRAARQVRSVLLPCGDQPVHGSEKEFAGSEGWFEQRHFVKALRRGITDKIKDEVHDFAARKNRPELIRIAGRSGLTAGLGQAIAELV